MNLISKKNIYVMFLIVICLLSVVIVPTYAKFGYTDITDNDVVGMSLAFDVSITNIEEYEQITVPANSSKRFNVNITNNDTAKIYYGVWYRMVDPGAKSSNVLIGELSSTAYSTSGSIVGCSGTSCSSAIVGVGIVNNTNRSITLDIGVASSTDGANYIEYLDGKKFISGLIPHLLNTVAVGSYVSYTGNNGCTGASCSGQNANYVDNNNMGYCISSSYKFNVNGWRVAYIDDNGDDDITNDNAILVSAGALDCMCTKPSGDISNSSCSSALMPDELFLHYSNMNSVALKYCNTEYAKGGVCDINTVWAMNAFDFEKITGSMLDSCYQVYSTTSCGYNNDLIDNGGYYWYAMNRDEIEGSVFYWDPRNRNVSSNASDYLRGVRPLLNLESSVIVTGGLGTYDDPYVIAN